MFYRIRIDASFTELPPVDWLRHIRDYFIANAQTINPGALEEEPGYIILEKCYHDEDPLKPCYIIEEYHTAS